MSDHEDSERVAGEIHALMSESLWRLTVMDGDSTFVVEGSDDLIADGLDPLVFASIWVDLQSFLMTLPVGLSGQSTDGIEHGATARVALGAAIDRIRQRHPRPPHRTRHALGESPSSRDIQWVA